MSEKMFKRSLALGALMAFVISSSAMAAEPNKITITKNETYDQEAVFDGTVSNVLMGATGKETITIIGKDEENFHSILANAVNNTNSAPPESYVMNIAKIVIDGVYRTDYYDPYGPISTAYKGAVLYIGTEKDKIGTIETAEGAKMGLAFNANENSTLNVNAVKIDVRGTTSNNVYAHQGSSITINADDIYLSGERVVATDEIKINTVDIVGTNSVNLIAAKFVNERNLDSYNAIRCLSGSTGDAYSTINIDGGEIYIEAPQVALHVTNKGTINVAQKTSINNQKVIVKGDVKAINGGTVNLNLGTNGSLTGKAEIVDGNGTIKLDFGNGSTWNVKDTSTVSNVTFGAGSVLNLGQGFVYEAKFDETTGKALTDGTYAITAAGSSTSLTVANGAKLQIEGIKETTYNIANGFEKYDVADSLGIADNALMEAKKVLDEAAKTFQVEIKTKEADTLATEMGVSSSTAQSLSEVTTAAQNADVEGNANGTGDAKAVAFVDALSGVDSKVAGQAFEAVSKMAEAGGNSATAASIVKNVTGVTNDRLSFNCGHSAPHKGGHGVGLFEEGSGADVWVEYVHGKDEVEDMPSTAGASSYEGQYNGIVMGVDFKKVNKFQSGLAFNYGEGDTNSVGSVARTHSDYDFWGIGYYGSIHNDDSNVIFDIGYAKTDSDVENTSGVGVNFKASPETTTWTAGVKLEKLYQNENVQIVPYTGLRFMSIDPEDYSTECASASYQMERQNVWLLPLGVSIRQEIANDNGWTVSPKVDLSYIWAFGDTDSEMEFSTLGTKTNIGYEVMDDGSFLGLVGIEAHKGQWGYGVAYSYQKGDHSESKKWYVDVNYSF